MGGRCSAHAMADEACASGEACTACPALLTGKDPLFGGVMGKSNENRNSLGVLKHDMPTCIHPFQLKARTTTRF